jgi:hypothetical protein
MRPAIEIEFPPLKRRGRVNGRDEIFDAIVVACGGDLKSLTPAYAAKVGTAKRDILGATPTCTPEEIQERVAIYRVKYRDAACTPMALANHWPELTNANGVHQPRRGGAGWL